MISLSKNLFVAAIITSIVKKITTVKITEKRTLDPCSSLEHKAAIKYTKDKAAILIINKFTKKYVAQPFILQSGATNIIVKSNNFI